MSSFLSNNIRLLKTDKPQLQTLKWYTQVYTNIIQTLKLQKNNNISNCPQRAY